MFFAVLLQTFYEYDTDVQGLPVGLDDVVGGLTASVLISHTVHLLVDSIAGLMIIHNKLHSKYLLAYYKVLQVQCKSMHEPGFNDVQLKRRH